MKQRKKVVPIQEKLNIRQQVAIELAGKGDYFPLLQVCMECHKAEDKALDAINLGVPEWGNRTLQHYVALREYLENYIESDVVWDAYTMMVDAREKNV
jgi:hypothetical protein